MDFSYSVCGSFHCVAFILHLFAALLCKFLQSSYQELLPPVQHSLWRLALLLSEIRCRCSHNYVFWTSDAEVVKGKPLYVGLAEKREARQERLRQRYSPSVGGPPGGTSQQSKAPDVGNTRGRDVYAQRKRWDWSGHVRESLCLLGSPDNRYVHGFVLLNNLSMRNSGQLLLRWLPAFHVDLIG